MSGTSQKPAYVRTGVPMGAGSLIVFVAQQFGLDLTVDQALIVAPVVMYLYYVLGRALETYRPSLGYVLGIAKQPAYSKESAPAPGAGEDLVAVVVPDPDAEVPVQTDNGPRAEEGERLSSRQEPAFMGAMR